MCLDSDLGIPTLPALDGLNFDFASPVASVANDVNALQQAQAQTLGGINCFTTLPTVTQATIAARTMLLTILERLDIELQPQLP